MCRIETSDKIVLPITLSFYFLAAGASSPVLTATEDSTGTAQSAPPIKTSLRPCETHYVFRSVMMHYFLILYIYSVPPTEAAVHGHSLATTPLVVQIPGNLIECEFTYSTLVDTFVKSSKPCIILYFTSFSLQNCNHLPLYPLTLIIGHL